MIDFYLTKGYTLEWIEVRIKTIIDRKKLGETIVSNKNNLNYQYIEKNNQIANK